MKKDRKNLRRAEVILKVQCGLITATEAAKQLGISRKTYYEWEKKAMGALLGALEDGPSGRPRKEQAPELTQAREDNTRLQIENEILQQRLAIQREIHESPKPAARKPAKGPRTGKKNA
jgi:transposase